MTEQTPQPPAPADMPATPAAAVPPPIGAPEKPSQLQVLGVLTLVSGIINCIIGILWVFTIIWMLPAAYSVVLGILEIIYATKLMANPVRTDRIAKHIAIMQIINIVNGALLAVVVGILALVWTNEPKVKDYLTAVGRKG